jgi:hypothetical protein
VLYVPSLLYLPSGLSASCKRACGSLRFLIFNYNPRPLPPTKPNSRCSTSRLSASIKDVSVDNAHVTPYQLCALCRQVAQRFSQDIFWDDHSYKDNENSRQKPDPQILGALAQTLAHHGSLANLWKSALEGCHLCGTFIGAGTVYELERDERYCNEQLHVHISGRLEAGSGRKCGTLLIYMYPWPCDERTAGNRGVHIHRHRHGAQYEYCRIRFGNRSTTSLEARYRWNTTIGCKRGYEMINAWLHRCVNQHEHCRRSLDDIRPARLLDLEASLSDQDIRLVLIDDVGKQPYATLSHRWGDKACVKLEKERLEGFRSRILLELLPQTVREAVKVCRSLLVRYLWDALCIIQDEADDLAREIARMGSIYAGSLLTVAAEDSTDCESGCFRQRRHYYERNSQ